MLFGLLRLLAIFIWIRRLCWLTSLPLRMARQTVADFGKVSRLIARLFTPSFWSSLRSSVFDEGLVSLGMKIVPVVVFLVLGVGTLLLVVAVVHQAGNARGGETASASLAPAGGIGESNGKPTEVRRATAVSAQGSTLSSPSLRPIYAVVGVADGDYLNVHSGPGMNHKVVARLVNGCGGIQIVGPPVMNERTPWVPIRFSDRTGWVAPSYLKPE